MIQQHKIKTEMQNGVCLVDKTEKKALNINSNTNNIVGKLKPLTFTVKTNSTKQRPFYGSKLIILLNILLLYIYSVSAGQTFGEIVDEVGGLNTVPEDNVEEVKEADLPEIENVEELIMLTKMECEIIREFCEEVKQFEEYLNEFLENF